MDLIITQNYQKMSEEAANVVESLLRRKKNALLGLTTGNTPMGLYHALVEKCKSGMLDFRDVYVFSVEEYLGIPPGSNRSLFGWLNRVLIQPCGIDPQRVFWINGDDPEPQLACLRFDRTIETLGGLDLIVEGIGINGHIGFNEPGSSCESSTRIVALSPETRSYNFAYWDDSVPAHGLTVGLSTIMKTKHVLLMASGVNKAKALKRALEGPVTPEIPASYLQMASQVTVIADQEAASLLTEAKGGIRSCPHSSA